MSVVLLVMTDGRRCIEQTIPSALEHLQGHITTKVICDDSGSAAHRELLRERFARLGFEVIPGPNAERRGFGGAIRTAWAYLEMATTEPFVFHLEDDFTFNRPVDLNAMASVLLDNPHLVQLALRRQPWNDAERAAGGVVEQHPDDFADACDSLGNRWLEHRRFFTTNPSLYRRSLIRRGWPTGHHSEGVFTHRLLVSPKVRFGFWGDRASGEWVEHIGHERVGVGY